MKISFTPEEIDAIKKLGGLAGSGDFLINNEVRNQVYDWHPDGDYRLVPTEMRVVALAKKWKKDLVFLARVMDEVHNEDAIKAESRILMQCIWDLYGNFQDMIRSNPK